MIPNSRSRKYMKRRNFIVIIIFALALWMLGSTQNRDYQIFQNLLPNIALIRISSYFLDSLAIISCIFLGLLLALLLISSFDIYNYKKSFLTFSHKTKTFVNARIHDSRLQFIIILFIVAIILANLINTSFPMTSPQKITQTSTITNPLNSSTPANNSTESTSNSVGSQLSTSCVAPCTSINFQPLLYNLVNSYLLLIFIGIFLLLVAVLRLRSSSTKKITAAPSKTLNKFETLDKVRETIISKYLKASTYLEQLGADKRFSLTPQEFETDVKRHLKEIWSKFPRITYFYELARFSDSIISESDLLEFNTLITEFYAEVGRYIQELTPGNESSKKT